MYRRYYRTALIENNEGVRRRKYLEKEEGEGEKERG
jgi:hypothetical protein